MEIARQGGKNELSAQLELLLLTLYITEPQNLIKCSPTFKPQTVISMMRLKDRLNDAGYGGFWEGELGYIIRLGNARAIFLSAEESANVVGNTAHILLEIDESQDVSKEKYTKDFKPMGATTNVTTVHYGTTWDESTLLEEIKQTNLELERKDGIRRHFRYDWQEVAKYNPRLSGLCRSRKTCGLVKITLCSLPNIVYCRFTAAEDFFQRSRKRNFRVIMPENNRQRAVKLYVAGIDLAGEAEEPDDAQARVLKPRQDSTVITIGELDYSVVNDIQKQPGVKLVEHYRWTGVKHTELYPRLVDILKNVWRCKRVCRGCDRGRPAGGFIFKTGTWLTDYSFYFYSTV